MQWFHSAPSSLIQPLQKYFNFEKKEAWEAVQTAQPQFQPEFCQGNVL
jgi:hypothetical protein